MCHAFSTYVVVCVWYIPMCCMWVHVSIYTRGGHRGMWMSSLSLSVSLPWGTSWWTGSLLFQLQWWLVNSQSFSCLCHISLGLQVFEGIPWSLCGWQVLNSGLHACAEELFHSKKCFPDPWLCLSNVLLDVANAMNPWTIFEYWGIYIYSQNESLIWLLTSYCYPWAGW